MKKLALLIGAAMAVVSAPASAQAVGSWVLAPWHNSAQLFPGVVTARNGETYTVTYDDGTTENQVASDLHPFNWGPGTQVECRWTDGQWYPATIQTRSQDGYTLDVRYNQDHVQQHTNTGRCRQAG